MPYPRPTYNTNNVTNLPSFVKDNEALLKQAFDKVGIDGKNYIETVLLPYLEANGSVDLGTPVIPGVTGTKVSEQLLAIKSLIDGLVVGQVPDNSLTQAKMAADMKKDVLGGIASFDNVNFKKLNNYIINGNFQINQREKIGTVVLLAGQYGHDRWKAGSLGCTYTFATVENVTTITIIAGSLVQIIEGLNISSGTHVLSWVGTSQGKINSSAFGVSGVTLTLTGGTNVTIEFNTGTLSKVVLNKGFVAQEWQNEIFADVLKLCKRYYEQLNGFRVYNPSTNLTSIAGQNVTIPFMEQKRIVPTVKFEYERSDSVNVWTSAQPSHPSVWDFTDYSNVTFNCNYVSFRNVSADAEL